MLGGYLLRCCCESTQRLGCSAPVQCMDVNVIFSYIFMLYETTIYLLRIFPTKFHLLLLIINLLIYVINYLPYLMLAFASFNKYHCHL